MRKQVTITQEDIDNHGGHYCDCGLASSINREFGLSGDSGNRSSVHYHVILIKKPSLKQTEMWLHTPESLRFVLDIDKDRSMVKPCTVEIVKEGTENYDRIKWEEVA